MRWGVTFEAFMGDLMMNWNSMMDRNLQKVEEIDMSIIISLFSKTCNSTVIFFSYLMPLQWVIQNMLL